MPELTLAELKRQLRKEKRKIELAQQDLTRLKPEDQRRTFEGSLLDFTKESWRWVEPSPFCSNWHIECMCEHFEAVSHRQILRLLINVPPRHSKSLGLNVFFPAWVWANNPNVDGQHPDNAIRKDCWLGPGVRFAYLSYDAELSTNHSIKCRQLIESPWYHDLWGERFCLTQNLKTHYDNNRGGERKSGTIHGMTGFGANILGYDDPHALTTSDEATPRLR
jgi:hypothetical protein